LIYICTVDFLIFVHNLCMKYLDSKKLSDSQFKRYTGISRSTFSLIVDATEIPIQRPKKTEEKL